MQYCTSIICLSFGYKQPVLPNRASFGTLNNLLVDTNIISVAFVENEQIRLEYTIIFRKLNIMRYFLYLYVVICMAAQYISLKKPWSMFNLRWTQRSILGLALVTERRPCLIFNRPELEAIIYYASIMYSRLFIIKKNVRNTKSKRENVLFPSDISSIPYHYDGGNNFSNMHNAHIAQQLQRSYIFWLITMFEISNNLWT